MAQSLMSMIHLSTIDWRNIQFQLLEGAAPASALFTESMLPGNIAPDLHLLLVNTYALQL